MSLPLKDKTWWKQQWQGRFENVNNWYQRVFIIFIIDQCHQRNFFYIHVYPCLAGPVLIGGGFMTIGFSVEATQSPITHHLRSSCSEEKFQKYARLLHIFFFLRITLFVWKVLFLLLRKENNKLCHSPSHSGLRSPLPRQEKNAGSRVGQPDQPSRGPRPHPQSCPFSYLLACLRLLLFSCLLPDILSQMLLARWNIGWIQRWSPMVGDFSVKGRRSVK